MTTHDLKNKQDYDEALFLWETSRFDDSLSMLRELVKKNYAPAVPKLLWRLWGNGNLYDEFTEIIASGIKDGNLDCMYIDLWRRFANRPATEEYWTEIARLALQGQKNSLLAIGLKACQDGRPEGIDKIIESYPCRLSIQNLAMVLGWPSIDNYQRVSAIYRMPETLRTVVSLCDHYLTEIKPWTVENRTIEGVVNNELSNDAFNAKIFSPLRMKERRLLEKGETVLSYQDIMPMIVREVKERVPGIWVMEGLTKNAWALSDDEREEARERHSIYLMKRVEGGKWMTLRISDHTSNLGDYYKFRRMFVPSDRDYANLSIMLHGDREQKAELKYSFKFRAETAEPCVTVRDEDFQSYRPFMYTLVHYVPGIIDNISKISDAIIKWFSKDGLEPYRDPWRHEDNGPTARITAGPATIETWDIKYERRKREQEQ